MKLIRKLLPGLFRTNVKKAPVSRQEFQSVYLSVLREKYPEVEFSSKEDFCILGIKDEGEYIHHLDNAYNEYRADIDGLNRVVNDFVNSAGDLYAERTIDIANVVPMIKPVEYPDVVTDMFAGREVAVSPMLTDHYNEELIVAYANDGEHSLSYLREEDLEKIGIERPRLLEIALKNLDNKLPQIERHGDAGFYMLTAGGVFELSLILMPWMWDPQNLQVDGDFVIAVPNRDMLLVTGSNDVESLSKLAQMASDSFHNGSYAISPNLFRWNGERFVKMF